MEYGGRRQGKSVAAVMQAKFAQSIGKRPLFITNDQQETAAMLSRHGALSEIIGDHYVAPRWPKSKLNRPF